jgi:geranylgeranyl pyrophosphate synthase
MFVWDNYRPHIIEKYKQVWYQTHPSDIGEYSWNYLFTDGKEIRPKLFCELWNYLNPESTILGELAFAIECIHVSSVVLDDTPWMDNASERRGKKTLHNVFSPKKAVVIAYDLIDMALDIWKNNKPPHIDFEIWINLLKSKLQRLMIGQWFDLEKKGSLIELASLKTGTLFELVTETVAVCINLDAEFWRIWGNNLGILFQWMDDYDDMEEDKQQNNRNAFNESFDTTMTQYIHIWTLIEKGIGKQWFERYLGKFMVKYFVESIKINNTTHVNNINNNLINNTNIYYVSNISVSEAEIIKTIKNKVNIDFNNLINGKDLMTHLWRHLDNMTINDVKHNLWSKDESQWNNIIM